MNDQTKHPGYELAALGEIMLLTPDKLPAKLAEELTVLQDMLEIAAAEESAEDTPVPPAYGKTATPMAVDIPSTNDNPLILRQDTAISYPTSMAALSQRKKDSCITVPRVVKEGGSDA